jgi:RimJ/RimL family protein N-acetyltransferase
VRELAGDGRIAATTFTIPHPYPEGVAEKWIDSQEPAAAMGKQFHFAITLTGTRTPGREHALNETGFIVGAIAVCASGDPEQRRAELGYWIGVPYWGKGFATEAGRAVLEFAFTRRRLHRVFAQHYMTNPASGRVMQKLGMTAEGTLREHIFKNGEYLDVAVYSVLQKEWQRARRPKRLAASPMLQLA